MNIEPYNILAGFVFGTIGFGAWRYGRQLDRWKPVTLGLALIIYPYFTPWAWLTWTVGIALCVTLNEAKGNVFKRVPIRCLVSRDGSIMAGLYHPRLKSLWLRFLLLVLRKRIGRIIDFETEFADGSFVCTSNALSAGSLQDPPLIDAEYHPAPTPWATLLGRHRERLAKHQKSHATSPLRLRTIGDLRASQNRMNAIKAAWRGELNGITLAELEKLSPSKALAEDVHREIRRLHDDRRAR